MDRRRVLGIVGSFALAAVFGTLGAGKTKAAAASCCCGDLCVCGDLCGCEADCGDVCDCCGPDCCGDTCCCDSAASKPAGVTVASEKCCCENDAPSAKATGVSCCAAITANS